MTADSFAFVLPRDELMVNVNDVDNKGRDVLFYCITGSDVQMLDYLVSAGVNIKASTEGISILMQVGFWANNCCHKKRAQRQGKVSLQD